MASSTTPAEASSRSTTSSRTAPIPLISTGSPSRSFPLHAYDPDKPPNYQAWWGLPALPKFNTNCPEVREFLWGIGRKWIEFGIDGWRLDVPNEIDDDDFWREFRNRVRAVNPEAYIVGEVWTDSERWLKGDMWDAVMNYQFTRACIAFFIGERVDEADLRKTSLFPVGPTTAEAFRKNIERLLGLYHPSVTSVMLNLLSSHDMARFVSLAQGDVSALRLATLFQMTYPGAPSIYYGDEIGMTGGHDPANRGAFPWHQTESWNTELLHEFQRLIALRRAAAVIAARDVPLSVVRRRSRGVCAEIGGGSDDRRAQRRQTATAAGSAGGQSHPRGNSPVGMLVPRFAASAAGGRCTTSIIQPRSGRVLSRREQSLLFKIPG